MASIKWLEQISDIPKKLDPLAAEIIRRFNGAVAYQSTELVNGKPLRTVLENCYNQQNSLLDCTALQRAEALGVDVVVNLTSLKADIANAFLNEALTGGAAADLPWVIQPTPRPDIAQDAKDEIVMTIRQGLEANMFGGNPGLLVETVRQLKLMAYDKESEAAKKAADAMLMLIADQCAEGGFARALSDFLHYFVIYPYAVFTGPFITRAPRLVWGKTKPRIQDEIFPTFRAVSPFDFAYSPDSPDTQRGTCVFTRTLWTRRELLQAMKLQGYIHENVLDVLESADRDANFPLEWLSRSPDEEMRSLALWASNVRPIEVLTHYGLFSGRELERYNFKGLDSTEFYNATVAMVSGRVIQVKVYTDPRLHTRPIYTASFYRTGGDRIAGDGIAQRIRDVERAYIASLQYLMRNASFASAPISEADYSRLAKYLGENELGQLIPGTMYLVDSNASNRNEPAIRFQNIPANMPAYAQLLEMFMQLADKVTNIPAALHGEAVGSGAMRTFRGMSMLQGNATKALTASAGHISEGVFDPLGHLLYNTNMIFSPDVEVKGDSQIVTKGAEGLLQREMEKQSAMEILQILGGAAAGLGQMVNISPAIQWALDKLLTSMGVPGSITEQMKGETSGQGMMMDPNANPAPPSPTGAGVMADVSGGEA